ncbi:MAG: TonB-dependent receptor [Myxococcales bacterium]
MRKLLTIWAAWILAADARAQEATDPDTGTAPDSGTDSDSAPVTDADTDWGPDSEPVFGAVAVAPARGSQLALRKVPRNVLRLDASEMREQHPLGVQDALELRLGSVVINDVQNNPLQPDVQFRGFTASPLLGTPQGLAVYQNGVCINEPFGDVLQWDLVPELAIEEVQVIPGANPLYGLNALGGALALRMKNGFDFDGQRVTALAGSFARHQVSAEVGRALGDWAVYAAASSFGEQGFRDASRSRAIRGFADLRHRDDRSEVGLSATLAATDLNGNGPVPVELLAREGRGAVYTYPDNTDNGLLMLAADAERELGPALSVQGTAYLRHLQRDTLNGDEADLALCEDADAGQVLCDDDDRPIRSEPGALIPVDRAFDGQVNTSATTTDGLGASLQLRLDAPLAGRENQLLLGASYDAAHVAFLQRAEAAYRTPDRSVLGQGIYLTGAARRTSLRVDNRYLGVYASDTLTLVEDVAVHASARLGWAHVELDDRDPAGKLDGDHHFLRLNPSAGLTWSPLDTLTLFASYGESNRTPSAAELACADPDEPCRVPNAFVADPPLRQVVSRSVELGARGRLGPHPERPLLRWSVAGFASENQDDILFVAGSRVGTGYFRNAGRTRRAGLELDLSGASGPLRYFLGYTLLRATFESRLSLPGLGDADDGPSAEALQVRPGDRIPGLPTHSLKLGLALVPVPDWELGASAIARGGAPFRGDESNQRDDLDGYLVVTARARYQLLAHLQAFVRVENLFDSGYETFGVLADPSEVLPTASDPRFVSPGPPRAIFAGLTLHD